MAFAHESFSFLLRKLVPSCFGKRLAAAACCTAQLFLGSAAHAGWYEGSADTPQLLGKIPVKSPAFLSLIDGVTPGTKDLMISSFGISGDDKILSVSLLPDQLSQASELKATKITDQLTWPNSIAVVPDEIAGPNLFVVGTGFLVPGRTTGEIAIVDQISGKSHRMTTPKKDWFYHKIEWVDINRDGRLDMIAARAKKSMFGPGVGELLWLEQPSLDALANPWQEHVIAQGPDVHFVSLDLNSDGHKEIVAAEFFSKKLSVHWQSSDLVWHSRVIDASLGNAFDVLAEDINLDGRKDLVVTNHQGDSSASVYAYEVPSDFTRSAWTKHTLLTGIKTEVPSINAASPGSPLIWHQKPGQKPHILVAGDGSAKVHWLVPNSADQDGWDYDSRVLLKTSSTIGSMAIGDVDGDGSMELFVPAYDENFVYVLRMPAIHGAKTQ
jgi:hypothetical protein